VSDERSWTPSAWQPETSSTVPGSDEQAAHAAEQHALQFTPLEGIVFRITAPAYDDLVKTALASRLPLSGSLCAFCPKVRAPRGRDPRGVQQRRKTGGLPPFRRIIRSRPRRACHAHHALNGGLPHDGGDSPFGGASRVSVSADLAGPRTRVAQGIGAPAHQPKDVARDLPLLVFRERLVGDQGENKLR
jgi:hypothetical protein